MKKPLALLLAAATFARAQYIPAGTSLQIVSTTTPTSGTVTSVAITGQSGIGVSGSPITSSGTITLSLGAITPTTVNGLTITPTTGTLTLAGNLVTTGAFNTTIAQGGSYTLTTFGSTTIPVFSQQVTFAGPTAARTVTLPDANITVAITTAAQTFTGNQTFSGTVIVPVGAAATPSIVFSGATTDGIYHTSGALDVAIGGVRQVVFDAGGVKVDTSDGAQIKNAHSTATSATLVPNQNSNDGIGGVSGHVAIINSGATSVDVTSSGVTATSLAGTGSRAVLADANGLLSAPVSDEKLKEPLRPLPESYGIAMVMALRPSIFKFKDKERFGDRDYIGFGARATSVVLPEVTGQDVNGTYYLTDEKITAVLVKAVQQQQAQIAEPHPDWFARGFALAAFVVAIAAHARIKQ